MEPYRIIKRCIIGALAAFFGMTAICLLLNPQILQHYTYGISTFGSIPKTMVPYYIGFAITIFCLGTIAWQLLRFWPKILPLGVAFWLATAFMIGVAATSFSMEGTTLLVHLFICLGLTVNELLIVGWLLTRRDIETLDLVLAVIFLATVIVSVLPVIHTIPVLKSFPLRELIIFATALGLTGRAALRACKTATKA